MGAPERAEVPVGAGWVAAGAAGCQASYTQADR
jgi:hypothetical protein